MGWEILIGEWDEDARSEDPEGTPQTVAHVEVAEAPAFDGDDAGHSNCRRPSYVDWHSFCRATGLADLFHGKAGLFAEHPSTVRLTKRHARIVKQAREMFQAARPAAQPTFLSASEQDHHLARLIWLEWWVNWAIANCKRPAIHNR